MRTLLLACLFVLSPILTQAAMIEIHAAPDTDLKTMKATSQELDASLVRSKDLMSHARQEWTAAGCPALQKSEQCVKLLDILLDIVRHSGPSGSAGNITITNSAFTTYETPEPKKTK